MYRHWRELFYPRGLPQRDWFRHYAEIFDTVEINFSFYRLPSRLAFRSWNEKAPPGFCFAVKGSRSITHIRRLQEPGPHVQLLFDHAAPLLPHLGPLLWQLPPTFKRDDDRLAGFLAHLPNEHSHSIEVRHPSWRDSQVHQILKEFGVALCVHDRKDLPGEIELTTNWTYIRLHQGRGRDGNYTRSQLEGWAARIAGCRDVGVDVWVYFNNDQLGFAVRNALELRRRLES